MLPVDWIAHRRPDGERLGWMLPDGDGVRVVDLLGRERTTAPIDWLEAEELLEELGIGYLADAYALTLPGMQRPRVRIVEVSTDGVTVVTDDWGASAAVGAEGLEHVRLPFPVPADALVPLPR